MTEDESFNAFLKRKLEEDVKVPEFIPPPKWMLWWRPVLMAASIAVICGVFAWQLADGRARVRELDASRAIVLLEVCSGDVSPDHSLESFAEKLLAWQDAPFAEIEN